MEAKPEPVDDAWAELREAQLMTLSLPKTGMAVAIDIGEANDIHPKNKQDVGLRLALAAMKVAYGRNLVHSGPIYKSMKVEGNKIRLWFDNVGSGLVAKGDGVLKGFAIAGEDRKFVWAEAKIEGNTVVVWSEKVPKPVAVRYGWSCNPVCNLYNAEGLPASPFRTDDWPGITFGKK
jgi:sialate O-acetylesterase